MTIKNILRAIYSKLGFNLPEADEKELFLMRAKIFLEKEQFRFNLNTFLEATKALNYKDSVLYSIKINSDTIKFASDKIKNKREFILEAVKINSYAFIYSNDKILDDKEIILEAIKHKKDNYPNLIEFTSDRLKNDKEVVLKAIRKNSDALEFASDNLKNDKEVVLGAIKSIGWAFKYASNRLKADREFVMEVVKVSGLAVVCASENLKNDKEVVWEANKKFYYNERQFIDNVVECKKQCVAYGIGFSKDYFDIKYRDFFKLLLNTQGEDKNYIAEAVKLNGVMLKFADEEIKNNKEVVLEVVKQNVEYIEFASKELQEEIGNNDPVQYLESYFERERLQQELSNKPKEPKKKVFKI